MNWGLFAVSWLLCSYSGFGLIRLHNRKFNAWLDARYGGWNGYVSAEVRYGRKDFRQALIISILGPSALLAGVLIWLKDKREGR